MKPSALKQKTTRLDTIIQKASSAGPQGISVTPPAFRRNHTGLPDMLKTGVESLSGLSLDEVRVHYNSSKPAQFQALAYTQGKDIHVAPGQERHLPHEAWHVVQQKQRRVNPNLQMKGVGINDDATLEQEANVMGAKALQSKKPKESKSRAVANSVAQKKSDGKQDFGFVDIRPKINAQRSLQLMTQKTIQLRDPASTDERTKAASIGDRHNPPHPFMDLGGWYKTLMTGRIADLYRTAPGFQGHAIAVQLQLDHLIELIDKHIFQGISMDTAKQYEASIKHFLVASAKKIAFDIPKFIFRFSSASSLSIERRNGRLYVNGQ